MIHLEVNDSVRTSRFFESFLFLVMEFPDLLSIPRKAECGEGIDVDQKFKWLSVVSYLSMKIFMLFLIQNFHPNFSEFSIEERAG
jgi:hypothetical protein